MSKRTVIMLSICVILLAGAIIYLLSVNNSPGDLHTEIATSGAMMNTIMPNATITYDSNAYIKQPPQRFDIIVFYRPDDRSDIDVKRIIGLPGETVIIQEGKVFINDGSIPLDDSFIRATPDGKDFGPYYVPEGSYFVLGDNRDNSFDSRVWTNTFVVMEDIIGKVLL